MPWFLTPHGPHFVVEPGTVDEYERRDYVVMTAQQVTDYYAGVAFPDPPSFATEAEVPGIVAGAIAAGTGPVAEELRAAFGALTVGLPKAENVTQGLYSRTQPTPDSGNLPIRPLTADPNVAGRLWCIGYSFAQIGFTDNNGTSWTAKTASPAGGAASVQQLLFAGGYLWAVCGPSAAAQGSLWRSPVPDASGNGIVWTMVFDLAAPPGGITVGDNATWRNSSLAVAGANVYLLEYSVATITGGTSLYYSPDSGATWTKPKTWANAKHGHAVKVIGGVPWVMLGDATFTDIGLWSGNVAATVWSRRSQYGEVKGGNTLYGINFFPITMAGRQVIVTEYDGSSNLGPCFWPSVDPAQVLTLLPGVQIPAAYLGTMRSLTLTAEGNLFWYQSSEVGALNSIDSIWMSAPPFTDAILLEAFPYLPPTETQGDPIESGDYIWFGSHRVRKEQLLGQGA